MKACLLPLLPLLLLCGCPADDDAPDFDVRQGRMTATIDVLTFSGGTFVVADDGYEIITLSIYFDEDGVPQGGRYGPETVCRDRFQRCTYPEFRTISNLTGESVEYRVVRDTAGTPELSFDYYDSPYGRAARGSFSFYAMTADSSRRVAITDGIFEALIK